MLPTKSLLYFPAIRFSAPIPSLLPMLRSRNLLSNKRLPKKPPSYSAYTLVLGRRPLLFTTLYAYPVLGVIGDHCSSRRYGAATSQATIPQENLSSHSSEYIGTSVAGDLYSTPLSAPTRSKDQVLRKSLAPEIATVDYACFAQSGQY